MENERLLALIKEYQSRVQEAVALLRSRLGINPMEWRQADVPQIGFVDESGKVDYFLHGIGCAVRLPSGPVDFDFGYEGRIDGFDAWRLWEFAESGTANFPEFADRETLLAAFAHATSQGLVQHLYLEHHDGLCYLVEGSSEAAA